MLSVKSTTYFRCLIRLTSYTEVMKITLRRLSSPFVLSFHLLTTCTWVQLLQLSFLFYVRLPKTFSKEDILSKRRRRLTHTYSLCPQSNTVSLRSLIELKLCSCSQSTHSSSVAVREYNYLFSLCLERWQPVCVYILISRKFWATKLDKGIANYLLESLKHLKNLSTFCFEVRVLELLDHILSYKPFERNKTSSSHFQADNSVIRISRDLIDWRNLVIFVVFLPRSWISFQLCIRWVFTKFVGRCCIPRSLHCLCRGCPANKSLVSHED